MKRNRKLKRIILLCAVLILLFSGGTSVMAASSVLAAKRDASAIERRQKDKLATPSDAEPNEDTELREDAEKVFTVKNATSSNAEKNEDNEKKDEEESGDAIIESEKAFLTNATPSDAVPDTATASTAKLDKKMPEFFYKKVVAGYEITLKAAEGIFPENTKVEIERVEEVDDTDIEYILADEFADDAEIKKMISFDITFLADGEEIQPEEGTVEVTINMKRDLLNKPELSAKVFHIVQENMFEEIAATSVSEGKITYEASGFSVYTVALYDTGNYLEIRTAEDLRNIEQETEERDISKIVLMADIDLSGYDWKPIDLSGILYPEVIPVEFDGNGYSIQNMKIDITSDTEKGNFGLFGSVRYAKLSNIKLENIEIQEMDSDARWQDVEAIGGLCGETYEVEITNCQVNGMITSINSRNVAGIVGIAGPDTNISDSISEVDINAAGAAAGIATLACEDYSSNIYYLEKCANLGTIEARYAGGIVSLRRGGISYEQSGQIIHCVNQGTIKGEYAGGIAGGGELLLPIIECGNEGDITFVYYSTTAFGAGAGGIVGTTASIVTKCYNSGNISVEEISAPTGGIAADCAQGAQISDCYNCGTISSTEQSGGIVGTFWQNPNLGKASISRCYNAGLIVHGAQAIGSTNNANYIDCYAIEQTNQYADFNSSGLTILSDSNMRKEISFTGFDFNEVWTMGEESYPYPIFQWQTWSPNMPEIPGTGETLALVSITPENGAVGVKKTDDIVLEFNKKVDIGNIGESSIYVKDYDSDEIIYKDTAGYYGLNRIVIRNALKDCQSNHCYIYIPADAVKAKVMNEETGEEEYIYFEGITDKRQYSFWMEGTGEIFIATFNSMGGSEVGNRSFRQGTQVRRPADPVRTGYTFDGWYLDAGCTQLFDFTTIPDKDITLYAGWIYNGSSTGSGGSSGGSSSDGSESSVSSIGISGQTSNYSDDWRYENDSWKCYGSDGKPLTGYQEGLYWNGIKGNWFFDENGNMLSGWQQGHFFNDSSNGYWGIEITDKTIASYMQGDDAKSTIADYTFAVIFVEDIDTWTGLGSSLKNWTTDLKATAVGLWDTAVDVFTGEASSLTQNIADAYMKDPVASKAILADIVNKMFSTETWRLSADYDQALSVGSQVADFAAGGYDAAVDTYWKNVEEEFKRTNIDWNDPGVISAGFGTIKTLVNSSQEFQKMFMDYSQNIAYLESLKKSAPSNGVLCKAIDDLIVEYETQAVVSAAKICNEIFDSLDDWNKLGGMDVDLGIKVPSVGDDVVVDITKDIVDQLAGTSLGKVDAIIQLALKNANNISAVDKVIYSTYLRSDAIAALSTAEAQLKSGNASENTNAIEEYHNAFACAKAVTVTQYENMLKFYESGAYKGNDRQDKIDYLYGEIDKLNKMTFIDYAEQQAVPYYNYVSVR